MSNLINFILVSAVVAVAISALSTEQTASIENRTPVFNGGQGILPIAPESYIDVQRIWSEERRPVPVCWEESANNLNLQKTWIEQGINEIFEVASSVRFSGTPGPARRWQTCDVNSPGIRLSISDMRPRSLVGQQFKIGPNGTRTEFPTTMRLNVGTGLYSLACQGQQKQCTRYLAAHEFAHAIGFLHEHLRPDAPADCKSKYAHDQDDEGYKPSAVSVAFDPMSITNYCTHVFKKPMPATRLSALDIIAINHFYGTQ